MDYKTKYLKYKYKYIQLLNLIGGTEERTKKIFMAHLKHEDINIKNRFIKSLENDSELLGIEYNSESKEFNVSQDELFDRVYTYINSRLDKKYMLHDYTIINWYCNNNFDGDNVGISTLQNIDRFNNNINYYYYLKENLKSVIGKLELLDKDEIVENLLIELEQYGYGEESIEKLKTKLSQPFNIPKISELNSLRELEDYIYQNVDILQLINIVQNKKIEDDAYWRNIEKYGKSKDALLFETHKVLVYHPKTELQSKYYGKNTKWCTTSKKNCQFAHYNKSGPLYIIQSKTDKYDKYQIFNREYADSKDEPVTLTYIKNHFEDEELNRWITSIVERDYKNQYNKDRKRFELVEEYGEERRIIYITKEHIELLTSAFDIEELFIRTNDIFRDLLDIQYFNKPVGLYFGSGFDFDNDKINKLKQLKIKNKIKYICVHESIRSVLFRDIEDFTYFLSQSQISGYSDFNPIIKEK